jgi:hypothetical protein
VPAVWVVVLSEGGISLVLCLRNCVSFFGNSIHAKIEDLINSLNSKFEYRNSKQILMIKIRMTKTKDFDLVAVCFGFWTL